MKNPEFKYDNYKEKTPKEWCNIFYNKLKESLIEKKEDLTANPFSLPERTKFFKITLIQDIGKKMGDLECTNKEYHRVDAILRERTKSENLKVKGKNFTGGYGVPIVYIESENSIENLVDSGDGSEVYKLCYFQGPLKVIFTNARKWDLDDRKAIIEDDIQYIIDAFVNVHGSLNSYLLLVFYVIENGSITFHFEVHDEMGRKINGDYNSFTI